MCIHIRDWGTQNRIRIEFDRILSIILSFLSTPNWVVYDFEIRDSEKIKEYDAKKPRENYRPNFSMETNPSVAYPL